MGSLVSTAMQTIPQRGNLTFLASLDTPTVRCGHCQLVQFVKETRKTCLRCKLDLVIYSAPIQEPPAIPPTVDDPIPYGHRLCLRIKVIRELKAMPQMSLAAAMGVPRTYISKLENLNAVPTLGTLSRVAEGLGVPLRQLTDESVPAEQIAMQTWAYGGKDQDLIAGLMQSLDQLSYRHRHVLAAEVKKLQRERAEERAQA